MVNASQHIAASSPKIFQYITYFNVNDLGGGKIGPFTLK